MPEPIHCSEQKQSVKCSQKTEEGNQNTMKLEIPRDAIERNQGQPDLPERGCPRAEPCPAKAAIVIPDDVHKELGAEQEAYFVQPEVLPPGPLGSAQKIPTGKIVPLDYWTPLAGLTGTRPLVDNFSISRYSPAEWRLHNQTFFRESQGSIQNATLAEYNAHRCMERVYEDTDKSQWNNNIRLNTRAGIIHRWKTELGRSIEEFFEETDLIQQGRKRTMRAMSVLHLIESIGKDTLHARCLRMEPDLVRDQVEEEMIKEIDLCAEIRDLYTRCLSQLKMQLKELMDAKQRLEFDWSNKKDAYEIDTLCRSLKSDAPNILWKPGSVRIPQDQSSPSGYEHFSRESMAQGQTALQRSRTLRANMHAIHEKVVQDLRVQADRVDLALSDNIDLTVQTCRRLENQLNKCLQQLSDSESLVDEMRAASKRLDGAMKCAQTRLDTRLLRNGVENCRDVPQFGLIEEVRTLSGNVTAMLSQITRAEHSTLGLMKARVDIEKEIIIKRKTLYVDRERCQLIRSFYPSAQALSGN